MAIRLPLFRALCLGFLLALTACAGSGRGAGFVVLENQRSHERVHEAYRNASGRVDSSAMRRISALMRDMNTGEVGSIDPRLIDFMADTRAALRLPETTPLIVTSGYRSPATQNALRQTNGNAAEKSYHSRGQAVDFKINGQDAQRIAAAAMRLRRGGVAFYPRSNHVHLDIGAPRTWQTW